MLNIDEIVIITGVVLVSLMTITFIRAFLGPTLIDRMLAVNIVGTKTTVLLIIIGFNYNKLDMFVDLALTYALLNFIASLAAARFIRRRKSFEAMTSQAIGVGIREDNK